jgi:hypothetical protein
LRSLSYVPSEGPHWDNFPMNIAQQNGPVMTLEGKDLGSFEACPSLA